jgi:PTH1 family peptidyl-tRNA hydrolase
MALFQRYQRNDQLVQIAREQPVAALDDDGFIKLIVGLGNVGKKYESTRHNIGFTVIDEFHKINKFPKWQEKAKFKAFISEDFVNGKKVILAKPTTYMNVSGEAVRVLKDFYKLENRDIVVIHDELDLGFGTIKAKQGGGSAGNNGIKSIIDHIGEDFHRIRFGIKNDLLEKQDAADFVLSKFSADESKQLNNLMGQVMSEIN